MSLLLDALRRAAASNQGPAADRYTVPRRPDPATGREESAVSDDTAGYTGLMLEPEMSRETGADAPRHTEAGARPETARRVAAGTLAGSRRGSGRRRGPAAARAVLGGIAVLGTLAAIGAGGWWYYLESQQAGRSELASWEPTAEPLVDDEPIAADREPLAGNENAAAANGAERDEAAATDEEVVARVDTDAIQAMDEGETQARQPEAGTDTDNAGFRRTEADAEPASGKTRTEPDTEADSSASGGSSSTETRPAEPARRAEPLVRASSGPSELTRTLQAGYSALRAGDVDAAGHAYAHALELAPDNRDALLGVASVAERRGNVDRAVSFYRRVLRDYPHDEYARAALAGLEGTRQPRRSETELKNLLRERPDSHALHFALGNVHAAESRWSEAQRAWFEAHRLDPNNPDYAYNLAVALDHLGQFDAARTYYRKALAGSDDGGAGFPIAAVRRRLEQLQ